VSELRTHDTLHWYVSASAPFVGFTVNVAELPEAVNEFENVAVLKAGQVPPQELGFEQAEHLKQARL